MLPSLRNWLNTILIIMWKMLRVPSVLQLRRDYVLRLSRALATRRSGSFLNWWIGAGSMMKIIELGLLTIRASVRRRVTWDIGVHLIVPQMIRVSRRWLKVRDQVREEFLPIRSNASNVVVLVTVIVNAKLTWRNASSVGSQVILCDQSF